MADDPKEQEVKKRAIFDSMSKRGQERVLRMGYENWDPFQEPKDPRDSIRGSVAMRADAMLRDYFEYCGWSEQARAFHFELRELCQGVMRGDLRARAIFEFCTWLGTTMDKDGKKGSRTPSTDG